MVVPVNINNKRKPTNKAAAVVVGVVARTQESGDLLWFNVKIYYYTSNYSKIGSLKSVLFTITAVYDGAGRWITTNDAGDDGSDDVDNNYWHQQIIQMTLTNPKLPKSQCKQQHNNFSISSLSLS